MLAPHVRKPERAEKWLFSRLPEWEEVPERPQPAQVEIELHVVAQLHQLAVQEDLLTAGGQVLTQTRGLFVKGGVDALERSWWRNEPVAAERQRRTGVAE